jgi:hypothetical protein
MTPTLPPIVSGDLNIDSEFLLNAKYPYLEPAALFEKSSQTFYLAFESDSCIFILH